MGRRGMGEVGMLGELPAIVYRGFKLFALFVVSGLYWHLVCQTTGSSEPWDADAYWRVWYPLSVGFAAIAGYIFKKDGWLAGGLLTFAQLPVMWFNTGMAPLIALSLLFLCMFAAPTVAVALLAGRFAARSRSG